MKNEQFNGFNDLHVSEHAKTDLLNKIELRKNKHPHRVPTWSKVLVSLALIATVMVYASSKQGSEFLDYEAYLTISAQEVEYPLQKIQQEMNDLDIQFDLGLISESEYQKQMKALKIEKEALMKKATELKQQFNLDQELDLNRIKFSSDATRDQQLKEFYLQKVSLESKEAELYNQNDQLMDKYEAGEIEWKEYIDNKLTLDQQQENLSTEKEQWEANYAQTDSNYQKLYEQKKLLEQQEDALEIEEDLLKEQYKQGLISRDEYKAQKKLIEMKEDELDYQDDQLDDLEDEIKDQNKYTEKESHKNDKDNLDKHKNKDKKDKQKDDDDDDDYDDDDDDYDNDDYDDNDDDDD